MTASPQVRFQKPVTRWWACGNCVETAPMRLMA